ncbi:hypothetical protein TSA6c_00130 [Azospirillum sp. TSA6c]|nr:hypothetical protein TSA6c_00130 [Azospirillum sp. TSA6c]
MSTHQHPRDGDSLSIAGEHIRWARSAGYSARQVVESLINRPTLVEPNWQSALSLVQSWHHEMRATGMRRAA